MGSYCSLYFDEMDVCGVKSYVPDQFCALFQESDRRVRRPKDGDADDDASDVVYEASRDVILRRLDLLGYTNAVASREFAAWLAEERARWAEYSADDGDWAAETNAGIRSLTFEEWRRRVPEHLANRYEREQPHDEIDRHMRESEDSWLWFAGYGSLTSIRAMLDACPSVATVALDISDLIGGGWINEDEAICALARETNKLEPRPLAPIVVLAEGSSDIRILQRSLAKLFPERQDYFSFFNHAELSVDGGAPYLIKFLKAFAAARAPFRMVAVFDNDAVGLQAFRQAKALNLPANMIVVRLPDTELARAYPTIGPQGRHAMDVNGQAAAIELYLGRTALTRGCELRPVRWAGYVQGAASYQGEVEGKGEVEALFLEELGRLTDPAELSAAYPELRGVWEGIFDAVEHSSSELGMRVGKRPQDEW